MSLLFVTASLLHSCANSPDPDAGPETYPNPEQTTETDEQITALDALDQQQESAIARVGTSYTQNDGLICQVDTYAGVVGFNKFIWLDTGTDLLYPGSLLEGTSVATGAYAPAGLRRGPLTITVNLQSVQGGISREISEAKYSTVQSAIHEILSQTIAGDAGAEVSWDVFEVYSASHLKQSLGIGVTVSDIFSLDTTFEWGMDASYQRVVARFTQKYYDVVVDTPAHPSDFLHESVTADEISTATNGISPVYISSVGYGRYALFCFETSDTSVDLKSLVEGFVTIPAGGIPIEVELEAETTFDSMLTYTNVEAYILGGSGEDATSAVTSFDQFRAYIENGGTYSRSSPGKPVSYTMRYLSNNKPAKIVVATEYEKATCSPAYTSYRITLLSLGVEKIDSSDETLELMGTIEVHGDGDGSQEENAILWSRNGSFGDYLSIPQGITKEINTSAIVSFPGLAHEDRSNAFIEIGHNLTDIWPVDITTLSNTNINQPSSTRIYLDEISEGDRSIIIAGEHTDHRVSLNYRIEGIQ